jgi:hypothetical protein
MTIDEPDSRTRLPLEGITRGPFATRNTPSRWRNDDVAIPGCLAPGLLLS